MPDHDETEKRDSQRASQRDRQRVAETYRRAIGKDAESYGDAPIPKGVAVKVAGYTAEELGELPTDAVVNSFGCGNPLAFSEVEVGDVVLDLGSGAGIDLLIAAKKVGPTGRVIGVDMTEEMLARARDSIARSGFTNVELRQGLIEELPVESDTVDWVISNCVINLSPEKARVFAEIARVLRPGGRMLVSDLVSEALTAKFRERLDSVHCCVSGTISEAAYRQGLERAGLGEIEFVERIAYDAVQLRALVESDCVTDGQREDAVELAAGLVGKVWSAKIAARKPR